MESLRGHAAVVSQHRQGRLVEATGAASSCFRHADVGRGATFGDLDNDGDVDIVVTNHNGRAKLLRNQAGGGGHWLQVRLEQPGRNRVAMPARVGVERRNGPPLWRRARSDGSYLSSSDLRVHVGLGQESAIDRLVVEWPDGGREDWKNMPIDRAILRRRGVARAIYEGK